MGLDYQEQEDQTADTAVEEKELQVNHAEPVTPYYSIILIACIVLVSIVQFATNPEKNILSASRESVFLAGFVKPLFLSGEYWRILTGATLHDGIIHLAFNSYALFILGKLVEFLSNRAHLAIVFVLSAIGGGILSLIFIPDAPSIGASGGVVGFLGYLTAYGFKRRKLLSNAFLKNMLFNIGFIAFFGIFVMSNVDNYGHLGGLLVGLVYGFIQIPGDLYADPRETGKITRILGYVSLGIFILTCIFTILLLTGIIGFDYSFIK
jgi:rhomboid protease GluP